MQHRPRDGGRFLSKPATPTRGTSAASWAPLVILAAAQFVMVLDSSVMNVSISQIVADLDTTIQGVQLAITAYTLVMAALMLAGAKLGDILGRDKAFAIGLGIYGLGSLTTALSPNLGVLLVGWSLVEGIGAAIVIPAIVSLIAGTYEGQQRATAFGIIGGVAGAAIAAGPLIGGWVTTEFSWRYVFAGEVVIVIAILLMRGRLQSFPAVSPRPRLDVVGIALSALGLRWGSSESSRAASGADRAPWGADDRRNRDHAVRVLERAVLHPRGRRPARCILDVGGAAGAARSSTLLLDRTLLGIVPLRAGLLTLMMQQLILLGTFFVLPVYLQVVLGLDAFETGKRLFPMSVTMFLAALAAPRLLGGVSPKRVSQAGLVALTIAAVLLLGTIDVELNGAGFAIALAIFGVGAGLLLSQLGNVIMSSVPFEKTNEAGGLQGTAQNLGASLGTALIGAVMIAALSSGFVDKRRAEPAHSRGRSRPGSPDRRAGSRGRAGRRRRGGGDRAGGPRRPGPGARRRLRHAELQGLKRAVGAVAVFALLSLWFTRRLPARPLASGPD